MDALLAIFRRHPGLLRRLMRIRPLHRWANRRLIERYAGHGNPRPRPFSLRMPYSSWPALTDRRYTGRQLGEDGIERDRPAAEDLARLFERREEIPSEDTSVLFAAFAQWFTDSFIRTGPETAPGAWRRNTSNHEIDLCQVYGLDEDATRRLRAGTGGRLKAQVIDGETWPPFLFAEGATHEDWRFADPDFEGLFAPDRLAAFLSKVPAGRLSALFASGLEQGNATPGNVALNTVFLRAHNHVAGILAAAHPGWDDERLFQTARNVMIVILLKIVLNDYIAHIARLDFPFALDPQVGETKPWKRSNWISVEFGLLYRWHALVPDALRIGARAIPMADSLWNPGLVTANGLGAVLSGASRQRAGRIGLHNTPAIFTTPRRMPVDGQEVETSIQAKTIELGRRARLRPYNAYRAAFGLAPMRSFAELTGDDATAAELSALYASIDDLDLFVGLFAERHDPGAMTGGLLTRMVAFDAFTHIFGNPLVARGVFGPETFSPEGMALIEATDRFRQVVDWVVTDPASVAVSFQVADGAT